MNDLIDRNASIRFISNIEREDEDRLFTFQEIKKMLWDAPAVNRWIPCSERLPENTGYYLVCDLTAEFDNIRGRQDVSKFVIGRHGGHWYGAIRGEYITHWMPLPELPER